VQGGVDTVDDALWADASPEMLRRFARGAMLGPTGLALTDAEGHIDWVNPAFTSLTGLAPAEVLGLHPFEVLLQPLHGSDELVRLRQSASGRIRLATRRAGDQVRISITDTATGMDEMTKQRIFDPFFTTKEVGKGTGQGLAIAHSCVVGKHEGAIDVVTAPGAGTTFHLTLPVVSETGRSANLNDSSGW
jgi:PAS domain S-box-containing protein